MTFTYDGADFSSVIKEYYRKENIIKYLDGTTIKCYSISDSDDKKIKAKMVEQAIERQEKMDIKEIEMKKNASLLNSIVSALGTGVFIENEDPLLTFVMMSLLAISIGYKRRKGRELEELKKYKIFLELIDDLKNINSSNGDMNTKPFDIDTLDSYTYSEVKKIYKNYKKLNEKMI